MAKLIPEYKTKHAMIKLYADTISDKLNTEIFKGKLTNERCFKVYSIIYEILNENLEVE